MRTSTVPGTAIPTARRGGGCWFPSPAPGGCAGAIESADEPLNARLLVTLLRQRLAATGGPPRLVLEGHLALEAVLFDQPERRRWVLALANLQWQTPHHAGDATVRLRLPAGAVVGAVRRAPDLEALPFHVTGAPTTPGPPAAPAAPGDILTVRLQDVGVLSMLLVEWT